MVIAFLNVLFTLTQDKSFQVYKSMPALFAKNELNKAKADREMAPQKHSQDFKTMCWNILSQWNYIYCLQPINLSTLCCYIVSVAQSEAPALILEAQYVSKTLKETLNCLPDVISCTTKTIYQKQLGVIYVVCYFIFLRSVFKWKLHHRRVCRLVYWYWLRGRSKLRHAMGGLGKILQILVHNTWTVHLNTRPLEHITHALHTQYTTLFYIWKKKTTTAHSIEWLPLTWIISAWTQKQLHSVLVVVTAMPSEEEGSLL